MLAEDCVTVTGSLEAHIRVRKGRGWSDSIRVTEAVARCDGTGCGIDGWPELSAIQREQQRSEGRAKGGR